MSNNTIKTSSLQTASYDDLRSILLDLLVKYAYKEGDFVLSSGARSNYYINGKQVTLRAEGALVIGRLIWQMLPENTSAVAGLTLGADPIVSAVSIFSALENQPIPALIIRKEPKGHGTKAYIEGPTLNPSATVVVLEDVVTTGNSALLAVERLQAAGYEVAEIIALVDRKQGARELYQAQGLKFQAIFDITQLQQYTT
ncbi:MAG: orotate phosphoribosyltransferase [Xenococcaceae cyanobacterium MO_207.B15]|nr:orotate phosphoribosyltransferase [Xenococcaceae cyanobacterium MO_207.B15]